MALPCGEQADYAAQMTLRFVRRTCTQTEIETGVTVLGAFVKDIAESLLDQENDVLEDFDASVKKTVDASVVRWKRLVDYLRSNDSPRFPVPNLRNKLDWKNVKVAKGIFDKDSSCLPDPFLLAAKAAINFSALAGKKLMPACRSLSSDDEEDCDK